MKICFLLFEVAFELSRLQRYTSSFALKTVEKKIQITKLGASSIISKLAQDSVKSQAFLYSMTTGTCIISEKKQSCLMALYIFGVDNCSKCSRIQKPNQEYILILIGRQTPCGLVAISPKFILLEQFFCTNQCRRLWTLEILNSKLDCSQ